MNTKDLLQRQSAIIKQYRDSLFEGAVVPSSGEVDDPEIAREIEAMDDIIRQANDRADEMDSDGDDFNTGIPELDALLQEVYWLGQGRGGNHDTAMLFMECLDVVRGMLSNSSSGSCDESKNTGGAEL